MQNNQLDSYKILCYLDYDHGRDVEILMPLIYYAETYLNAKVEFAFIRDIHKIYKKRPDLVLLANAIGSQLHFEITKYAWENKIPVFTLISEGNFRTDGTFDYWGYNTEKTIFQDYICHWSNRTKLFFDEVLPQYKKINVLTGATGFDRYKIYKFIDKKTFLRQKGYEKYSKVISYAGWAFGKMFNKTGIEEIKERYGDEFNEALKWMNEQMLLVEEMLRKAIENNPDILFILKRHPSEIHPHLKQADKNEMVNLKDYPNVIYTINDNIHDLISISDIVTGFETTTALETWIMKDTPTILLNNDENFSRDKLYKGSVIAHDYKEFQKYIDEYYATGTIKDFLREEKQKNREILTEETIGFADGLNHIRAGYYLEKSLSKTKPGSKPKVKFNASHFIWYCLVHIGKYFYSEKIFKTIPKLSKTIWIFENYKLKNLPNLKNKYFKYLDDFYKKNNINEKITTDEFWKQILN